MTQSLGPSVQRTVDDGSVRPEDLVYIDSFLELLHCLNDPFAGGPKISQHVAKIPVLCTRVLQRARRRSRRRQIDTVEQALALIGNSGLETELFQLLEELTILKAELGG